MVFLVNVAVKDTSTNSDDRSDDDDDSDKCEDEINWEVSTAVHMVKGDIVVRSVDDVNLYYLICAIGAVCEL